MGQQPRLSTFSPGRSPALLPGKPLQTALSSSLEWPEQSTAIATASSSRRSTTPTVSELRRVTVAFSGSNPPQPPRTPLASSEPRPPLPEPEPPPRPSALQDLSPFLTSAWTVSPPSQSLSGCRPTSPTCVELSSALRVRQPLLLSSPANNPSCWASTPTQPRHSQGPASTSTTLRFPAKRNKTEMFGCDPVQHC